MVRKLTLIGLVLGLIVGLAMTPALANTQSQNVVIIGGSTLDTNVPCGAWGDFANVMNYTGGGCIPAIDGQPAGVTFSAMSPGNVSTATLAAFDTAVLNVASGAMACDTNTLTATQQADLVDFVAGGKKLIIVDSECYPGPMDYSWLPYPFSTANPGALGQPGTLTIVEENTLSSSDPLSPYFIDATYLGTGTDSVGDMNVMTTYDPHWCVDMSGTNAIGVAGPVQTYAKHPSGTDQGLIIYNGLDWDYLYNDDLYLKEVWLQLLEQPFNPSDLPCGFTVVGITIDPLYAENLVGEDHTVTATLTDLLGNPQVGVEVTFEVLPGGPNEGASGTCSSNTDCTTDANGQVSFTYTGSEGVGTDEIEACFINQAGVEVCSQIATKEWLNTPPVAGCVESVNPAGKNIPGENRSDTAKAKAMNPDGFYMLTGTDDEDGVADVYVANASGTVVFGPFASGTVVKITEAPGIMPSIKEIGGPNSAVAWHITLDSDAHVYAVDSAGAASPMMACLVPPPPK